MPIGAISAATTIDETMVRLTLRCLATIAVVIASGAQADPLQNAATREQPPVDPTARRARKAQVEFDAVALQALIAPMLSGTKSGPLGSGQAGRYWQSLMIEHIARHIASSGQLRLLPRIPDASGRSRRRIAEAHEKGLSTRARARTAPATPWKTSVHPMLGEDRASIAPSN